MTPKSRLISIFTLLLNLIAGSSPLFRSPLAWAEVIEPKPHSPLKLRLFLDWSSWQTKSTLLGPTANTSLIVTNTGFCPGLGVSKKFGSFNFATDLSFIFGSGTVSSEGVGAAYQQSNVPAAGAKLSFTATRIASASDSEVGIRASFRMIRQKLETPSVAGYSIAEAPEQSQTVSLYSRWLFKSIWFEAEFGRAIKTPSAVWALGLGYSP